MEEELDVVQYRLKQCDEIFNDALALYQMRRYVSVANRLYYAAFNATSALLIKENLISKTHSGLKALLYEHFVKAEKVSLEEAKIYAELFSSRQENDYVDFIDFTKDELEELIKRTEVYIGKIKKLISD